MTYELTGLDEKVAVVTGAGRMRSVGRSIAVELARAGCDVVRALPLVSDVNLHGTFYMSRTFGRRFVAAGTQGCIVNISRAPATTSRPRRSS